MCKSEQLLETCSGSASGSIQWFHAHDEVNLKKKYFQLLFLVLRMMFSNIICILFFAPSLEIVL